MYMVASILALNRKQHLSARIADIRVRALDRTLANAADLICLSVPHIIIRSL